MKTIKKTVLLLLLITLCQYLFCACLKQNYVPDSLADPLEMYLYYDDTKVLLDDSESKPIIEEIEFEENVYTIDIIDCFYKEDLVYICAIFSENRYFGLLYYDFSTKTVDIIYVKKHSENDNWLGTKIFTLTNYFIILYHPTETVVSNNTGEPVCTVRGYDYFAIDYEGNLLDIPDLSKGISLNGRLSDTVKYSDNFKLIEETNGTITQFSITHLGTGEKTLLTTFNFGTTDYSSRGLQTHENDDLFCFSFYYSPIGYDDCYIVIYDKINGSIHTDLSDKRGFSAYVTDLEDGIFSFTNQFQINKGDTNVFHFYQYKRGLGLTKIHTISDAKFVRAQNPNYYNKKILYDVESRSKSDTIITTYSFDIETSKCKKTTLSQILKQEGLYSFNQYAFENYIFYVTVKRERGWFDPPVHFYLHRVDIATKKDEIVGYRYEKRFLFDRIDY